VVERLVRLSLGLRQQDGSFPGMSLRGRFIRRRSPRSTGPCAPAAIGR
jgi:hypothetical protein